ncbi:MAG: aspartate-semialdehyde dehydrogenase [Candidatus Thermofonsia Clade 1 bacterium]|uniref:aspartate-semialdehyde dehydrogenase n=1 Tax=Candidatus Thermofonsia Clade 1 bacterium TaxID=2364210 RepID=A0A2M8PIK1_9CHLR|nr:MAG: aspartate-semialdehyde dehydrogenase [Candidatus Thermofonsia Clade 1 bacterium]RMF49852.1 MAG: aspartate-semialdehyde dehydrogenase [Chloroflexota bacterium]
MIEVAVLGATGTVGQRFIQLLEKHPWFRVAEVAASERSVGRAYAEACHWLLATPMPEPIAQLTVKPLDAEFHAPVIMSALPSEVALTLEPELAKRGHLVSSNTSAHRLAEDVPLLLPEINAEHVQLVSAQRRKRGYSGALVTMSNCTTVPVAVALAPLRPFGIQQVQVVSLQAISGSGYPGVASFDIFDNILPYIQGEEEKVEREPLKILGALTEDQIVPLRATLSASCNRVPVLDGHTVVVSVKFERKPSLEAIREAWQAFQPHPLAQNLPSLPESVLIYNEGADRPQPRLDRDNGHGMATTIGRLRACNVLDVKFVALSHNTVRGAAGGAILNAELLIAQGFAQHLRLPSAQHGRA